MTQDTLSAAAARRQAGDLAGARTLAEQAVGAAPDSVEARLLLAITCFEQGNAQEAAGQFEALLALAPEHAVAHYGLGNALRQQGRLEAAASSYRRALEIDPSFAPALGNLGATYQELGRLEEAIGAFEQALSRRSEHPQSHFNLANALQAAGRLERAAEHYRRTLALAPQIAAAHSNLGVVLQKQGDGAGAADCFHQAIALDPNYGEAHLNLAHLLNGQDKLDEAIASYRRAIALMPKAAPVHVSLANALLKSGQAAEALAAIDHSLTLGPPGIRALALKSAALSQVGDRAGEQRLVDLEAMIEQVAIEPPSSYETLASFNRELTHLVTNHPTLRGDKTTVNGRDTGDLFGEEGPAITALRTFVGRRARAYLDRLSSLADHPLGAHRPERYHLKAWGVRMWRQGYQVPHFHQNAWLSGVYYVQLPDAVAGSEGHEGWIEFGRGTDDLYIASEPTIRLIEPKVGRLLIFPSYVWHRTLPFESDQERISIAFDLIPEA